MTTRPKTRQHLSVSREIVVSPESKTNQQKLISKQVFCSARLPVFVLKTCADLQ